MDGLASPARGAELAGAHTMEVARGQESSARLRTACGGAARWRAAAEQLTCPCHVAKLFSPWRRRRDCSPFIAVDRCGACRPRLDGFSLLTVFSVR